MGIEDREYYRDWWRKKTDYVEKADFRVSEEERQQNKRSSTWYNPKEYRRDRQDSAELPPPLPGAQWPWPYQALVFIGILFAIYGAYKLVDDLKRSRSPHAPVSTAPIQPEAKPQSFQAPVRPLNRELIQEEQRIRQARAKEQAETQKREDEWRRSFKPSPSCRENSATVDCANQYIRARREFDESYKK